MDNIKMVSPTVDAMFKSLFVYNEYFFKRFLISVLELNLDPKTASIRYLSPEIPIKRKNERKKIADLIVVLDDKYIINVEMNSKYYKYVKNRNFAYHANVVSAAANKGKIKDFDKYTFIQLNLNPKEKKQEKGFRVIKPIFTDTKKVGINNYKIHLRYLANYKDIRYNKDVKKYEANCWLAYFSTTTFEEANEVFKKFLPDEERMMIMDEVRSLSSEDFILSDEAMANLDAMIEYDRERIHKEEIRRATRRASKKARKKALGQGISQGISQGIEQNKLEVAKNMLKKNYSLDAIKDITGLSDDRLNECYSLVKM